MSRTGHVTVKVTAREADVLSIAIRELTERGEDPTEDDRIAWQLERKVQDAWRAKVSKEPAPRARCEAGVMVRVTGTNPPTKYPRRCLRYASPGSKFCRTHGHLDEE